ncbi:MAG: hypothetical protein COX62_04760 [Deltaproteobacteria bacterium CG_4_10_14_0_2_um_filter_43_8]|nr:MAG: hypothetical protein COV43_03250 [Deltaproteobacteria bacterium CG11_big_fil_rev_8_21_14_0_20_42_23]PJA20394.1 MAG: hypothetical protein COX62_04760 [Deltaproteobacteria bacterium CG_4_10_14_0_2_um_filter_43_8]PJC63793.1 MAG: hypothetical protein CO021_07865 [Deltaproteobacteria bacterium CG_4_9_14_0_2_um_filter_42_21]
MRKKTYFHFLPLFLAVFAYIFLAAPLLHAQEDQRPPQENPPLPGNGIGQDPAAAGRMYTDPIPVLAEPGQRDPHKDKLRTDATHLRFFDHPLPPAGSDFFRTHSVHIDGEELFVQDLFATPGLPGGLALDHLNMLAVVGDRVLEPLHGFCQSETKLGADVFSIYCQATQENQAKRAIQIADIYDTEDNRVFENLSGQSPLIANIIASSDYTLSPYNKSLYPRAIGLPAAEWPLLKEIQRIEPEAVNDFLPIRYGDAITYGIADIGYGRGLVTAAYDPIAVRLKAAQSIEHGNQDAEEEILDNISAGFFSPLVFYRSNVDALIGRLQLAGYKALDLVGAGFFNENGPGNVLNLLTDFSFNPISVERMIYYQADSLAQIERQPWNKNFGHFDGFAVVNQAPVFDLDEIFTDKVGNPVVNGRNHTSVFEYIGLRSQQGDFAKLTQAIFPNRLVSYVNFWGRFGEPWALSPTIQDNNPNSVFTPFASVIIPAEVYSAAPGVERVDGVDRQVLFVASSRPVLNRDQAKSFYVYKADPFLFENRLHTISDVREPNLSATNWFLPEKYDIRGIPNGFVPYSLSAADIDGDFCLDIAMTLRGEGYESLTPLEEFENLPDQHVYFRASEENNAMFSNSVLFYKSERVQGKCSLQRDPQRIFSLNVNSQIARAVLAQVDDNGPFDLLVLDLIPHIILEGNDAGKMAAYGFLFKDINQNPILNRFQDAKPIRFGFVTADAGLLPANTQDAGGRYLQEAAASEISRKLIGPSEASIDENYNLAAINGLPLMLPRFECPTLENYDVASPAEIYISSFANYVAEDARDRFRAAPFKINGIVIPRRCRTDICKFTLQNGQVVEAPFWANDLCCDPCNPAFVQCKGDIAVVNSIIGPTEAYCANRGASLDSEFLSDELYAVAKTKYRPDSIVETSHASAIADIRDLQRAQFSAPNTSSQKNLDTSNTLIQEQNNLPSSDQVQLNIKQNTLPQNIQVSGNLNQNELNAASEDIPLNNITGTTIQDSTLPVQQNTGANQQNIQLNSDSISSGGSQQVMDVAPNPAPALNIQKQSPLSSAESIPLDQMNIRVAVPEVKCSDLSSQQMCEFQRALNELTLQRLEALQELGADAMAEGLRILSTPKPAGAEENNVIQIFIPAFFPLILRNPINELPHFEGGIGNGGNAELAPHPVQRLSRAQIPPGPRHMTVVLNQALASSDIPLPPGGRPEDVPVDVQDPLCGNSRIDEDETCDIGSNTCDAFEICDINDCQCKNSCGLLQVHECGFNKPACGDGMICSLADSCKCVPAGGGVVPEDPVVNVTPPPIGKCYVDVRGFSSEDASKRFALVNEKYREVSGWPDDKFAEHEYSVAQITCCVAGGAAPNLSTAQFSLAYPDRAVLPNVSGNLLKYSVVQLNGTKLRKFTERPNGFDLVQEPVTLLPISEEGNLDVNLLPSIAVNGVEFATQGVPLSSVVPDLTVREENNITVINDVFQHQVFGVAPGGRVLGTQFDFSAVPQVDANQNVNQLGYACHQMIKRIEPYPKRWRTDGAIPESSNIENQERNLDKVMEEISKRRTAREQAGENLTAEDLAGLPWVDKFVLKLDTDSTTNSAKAVVLPGLPSNVGQGGSGCARSCALSDSKPDWSAIAFATILFWSMLGALRVGRKRYK